MLPFFIGCMDATSSSSQKEDLFQLPDGITTTPISPSLPSITLLRVIVLVAGLQEG
jgi:hypothetical protein